MNVKFFHAETSDEDVPKVRFLMFLHVSVIFVIQSSLVISNSNYRK